ncbi:hypothetical protein BDQ12DRAFT_605557, partial [Crucibulum laeve]
ICLHPTKQDIVEIRNSRTHAKQLTKEGCIIIMLTTVHFPDASPHSSHVSGSFTGPGKRKGISKVVGMPSRVQWMRTQKLLILLVEIQRGG